jgi:tetratricopeptide (TPR) repeat protein
LAKKDVENVQKLSQLAGDLRNENLTSESDGALRQAGLSFRVNEHNLKQALLFASISQAYQQLKKPDEAQKNIRESLKYLPDGNNINSEQGIQIKVLVKSIEINSLDKKDKTKAIEVYQEIYKILKTHPHETNPFKKNQIITAQNIESVHRGLLELLANQNQSNFRQEVWESLKQHFFAELDFFLKAKQWEEADQITWLLVIFIADREKEGFIEQPQIEKFSCHVLKQIDDYWVQNSKGHFGFSVQKKIWFGYFGDRLGIQPGLLWSVTIDYDNLKRFASAVGWYDQDKMDESGWGWYDAYMKRISKDPLDPSLIGGLPYWGKVQLNKYGQTTNLGGRRDIVPRFINCNI